MPKSQHPFAAGKAGERRWQSPGGTALLGLTLLVLGVLALLLPEQATVAASTGLGFLLVIAGAATILQVIRDKGVYGFNWYMLSGAAEIVGGLLIWLSPLKGAAAIALLIVIIIVVQGTSHLAMAAKTGATGRVWLVVSGLASLVVALVLVLRFPYPSVEEPGAMAGIALVVGGLAHLALALARRRANPAVPR